MGLGASVMCDCISKGLTIPEEFSKYFKIDEDGYPGLTLEYKGNEALHHRFEDWVFNACPHEEMELASEHVANWVGVRAFQNFLKSIDDSVYQIILEQLSNANGGIVEPAIVREILASLRALQNSEKGFDAIVLLDEETSEVIWEYIPAYKGKMILNSRENLNLGINESGFFIEESKSGVVFCSKRFEQRLFEPEKTEADSENLVEYKDLASEKTFTCKTAIFGSPIQWPDGNWQNSEGKMRFNCPKLLKLGTQYQSQSDYKYIIEPLIRLCEASSLTNNPIRWG